MTLKKSTKNLSKKTSLFKLGGMFVVLFLIPFLIGSYTTDHNIVMGSVAYGESKTVPVTHRTKAQQVFEGDDAMPPERVAVENEEPSEVLEKSDNYTVQAVLGAKNKIVLASGIDAKIIQFKLESGDRFKRGDVLVEYDCQTDNGRLNEVLSRQRVTERQLAAYQQLAKLDSASEIELAMAYENNEQNNALIQQIEGRLSACKHIAPWDGRVMRKMASQYEYVQSGRVLMEISSLEPLRAEFLIPSHWLRWLNIGTSLNIHIGETDRDYAAKIVNIFGEVDPVSQSVQVVAEMEKYHEELLPGMSGRASFTERTATEGHDKGFLGFKLSEIKTP